MTVTASTFPSNVQVPVVDRKTRWIVVQVGDDGTLFVEPVTLRLDPNWIGDIVWYVFTKGYSFPEENAVVFPSGSGFDGTPLPDPSRPGCWSTAATNNDFTTSPQSFSYSLTVLKADGTSISGDPVIENEPVP